jgi:hypothetical protein
MQAVVPYELVFGEGAYESAEFPRIREEAEHATIATAEPEKFFNLPAVAPLIREAVESSEHSAVEEFGPLLFQAYHFWRFGKEVFAFEEGLLRELLAQEVSIGEWELVPPRPAGYLQLPRNLVWARVAEDAQAEAIDGVFWTMVGAGDPAVPPFPRLDLLVVLGLLPGRPGFSIAEVQAVTAADLPAHWADASAREGSADFSNILPGGELNNYLGIETGGEVLKLISRCFWFLANHPERWDG